MNQSRTKVVTKKGLARVTSMQCIKQEGRKHLLEYLHVFLNDLPSTASRLVSSCGLTEMHSSSRTDSNTIWYNPPEDNLQFFKEEKLDGAVYNIFLKKVRYHTSPDEIESSPTQRARNGDRSPQSTFYSNADDDKKATLQWRLEEIRVIRYGTLPRLVEALSSETGEMDSSYVDAFFATYRTFTTANQVMRLLLERYKVISDDMVMKQPLKEGHKRSIRTVILGWLDKYPEDFEEPPSYPTLTLLKFFAQRQLTDNALVERLKKKITEFMKNDEKSVSLSIEDITVEFGFNLQSSTLAGNVSRSINHSLDFFSISSRTFAEQLTYIDAELFKRVIPYQCLGSVWSRRNSKKQASQVASVYATVNQFNTVSYRVIATTLKLLDLPHPERALIIERWIEIAQELRILKNFSSLKAILSGLQSTSVFRLSRVWALVSKSKMGLFDELAEIFSEENNKQMFREVLYREGTAKYADPQTVNTVRGKKNQISSSAASGRQPDPRRISMFETANAQVIQGTIPYLGMFLTDMTMIDTAFQDLTDAGLINFEKRRKEFEILTQIRLLQCAASLYQIQPEPFFLQYFTTLRVYDDNESYELSCEIQSETSNVSSDFGTDRHRRRSSLGYFSVRRSMISTTSSSKESAPSTDNNFYLLRKLDPDDHSVRSLQGAILPKTVKAKSSKSSMRHSVSVGSLFVDASALKLANSSKCSESIIAKIYFEADDSNKTNQYKSVLLTNCDHTQTVVNSAMQKYSLSGKPSDFCLFQRLANNTEVLLPEKANVFYAVDSRLVQINFVLRRKTDCDRQSSKPPRRR